MAGPSQSTTITRYELSQPFTEFDSLMNRKKYIGHKVFTPRPVDIQAADVGRLTLENTLFQQDTRRSPAGEYSSSDFDLEKYSYSTDEYGHEATIDDRQLAIYKDLMDAESIHAMRATNVVLDHFERDCAAAAFNTSTFTGALTYPITNGWNGPVDSTPIADIVTNAIPQFNANAGCDPNAFICNSYVLRCLINTNEMVDRIKFTEKADQPTMFAALADLLGIEKILVAGGYTNSANAPTTRSLSRIWGDTFAMLARVAESEDPQEPCIGRTFFWTGDGPQEQSGGPDGGDGFAVLVEEYRQEGRRGSALRARNDRQINPMYPEMGLLLTAVTQEGAT